MAILELIKYYKKDNCLDQDNLSYLKKSRNDIIPDNLLGHNFMRKFLKNPTNLIIKII